METLLTFSASRFILNEFIRLKGGKIGKISFSGKVKRSVLILNIDKKVRLELVQESDLNLCSLELLDCKVGGCALEPIAYEGVVTDVEDQEYTVIDQCVIVIGLARYEVGTRLRLANIFPVDKSHSCVQKILTRFVEAKTGGELSFYLFCPFISSVYVEEKEIVVLNPPFYSFFDCTAAHKKLTAYLQSLDALECANIVSSHLWPACTIASAFTQLIDGGLGYFADFEMAQLSDLKVPEVIDTDELIKKRIASSKQHINSLLIGKLSRSAETGQLCITDSKGSVPLALCENTSSAGGDLVVMKNFDLVTETFLIDQMVNRTCARRYIIPRVFEIFPSGNSKSSLHERSGSLFMTVVQSICPLEMVLLKPFKMESRLTILVLCLLEDVKCDGTMRLKKLTKSIDLVLSAEEYSRKASLQLGSFLLVERIQTQCKFEIVKRVILEMDASLRKGHAKLENECLFISSEVEDHVSRLAPPASIPQTIRSLLQFSTSSESVLNFRGLLLDIRIRLKYEKNSGDPKLLRLFEAHHVGLPVSFAELELDIGDERDGMFRIAVRMDLMNSKVMPLGLLPGAVVEGRCFLKVGDFLESRVSSSLHVVSFDTPNKSSIEMSHPSEAPFHYLSDFYGYPVQYPRILVAIQCYLMTIASLTFTAHCKRCSGSVVQWCCPIHGRLTEDGVLLEGSLHCSVSDGTYEAELEFDTPAPICSFLKLDSVKVLRDASLYGKLDWSILKASVKLKQLKLARFRITGFCFEAPVMVEKDSDLVLKKFKIGKQFAQGYSYPGRLRIKALAIQELDLRELTRKYLDILHCK